MNFNFGNLAFVGIRDGRNEASAMRHHRLSEAWLHRPYKKLFDR